MNFFTAIPIPDNDTCISDNKIRHKKIAVFLHMLYIVFLSDEKRVIQKSTAAVGDKKLAI